jgi:hypothetical protein
MPAFRRRIQRIRGADWNKKFAGLVEPVLGSQRCKALIAGIGDFETLEDLRELMA